MTTSSKSESAAKKDVTKLQRAIVDGLEDVKAQDVQVFNTEHLSPLFERVIVASGTSNRQTKALASSVRDAVREAGFPKPRTEGEDNGEWIIVDCGAAVAHIMQPAIRQYYRLEEIWGDKPVRLKLGAPKPAAAVASEDASAKKKPARKKAAAAAPAQPARKPGVSRAKPAAAAPAEAKKAPAKKAAASSSRAPVKTTAAKPASKATAAKTTAAKAPAAKSVKTVKTVVVKPAVKKTAAKAAPKSGARTTARPAAAAAKKAPARKKAV
jgi:ribosome-associated protein